MIKINQKMIDYIELQGEPNILEDCYNIKKCLKIFFGLDVSLNFCKKFWFWRSEQYDASWLNLEPDEHIVVWFVKYIKNWWKFSKKEDVEERLNEWQTK